MPGLLNNKIFKLILSVVLILAAIVFFSSFAGIIIVNCPVSAGTSIGNIGLAAFCAEDFTREGIDQLFSPAPLPLAGKLQAALDAMKQILIHDGRNPTLNPDIIKFIDADILFVG
ncbi:MAG: hypothetical protein Q4F36_10195 [Eubacterium sp.]|nr:hypothetical protein [Eubacterium sp.]MDO5433001.1 hypothetical protein [Eubacterium sp.]